MLGPLILNTSSDTTFGKLRAQTRRPSAHKFSAADINLNGILEGFHPALRESAAIALPRMLLGAYSTGSCMQHYTLAMEY